MNVKYILIGLGILGLILSLAWGVTQNQIFEPWTAVVGALLFLIGFFKNNESNQEDKKAIKQTNLLGFFNKSKIKNTIGKIRQLNFMSFKNEQEIDNSEKNKPS